VGREAAMTDRPLLFISHRHADRAIADVIRDFVTYRSSGNVDVYQSSSSDAQAPKIGRNINQELRAALRKAQVLLLVYTSQERDWDYCMWECGFAVSDETEETRIVVLQCGRHLPRIFADQLAVDLRDPEKVRRFVNEFLTDPGFVPGREQPLTGFQPNDAGVIRAADSLFENLLAVLGPDEDDQAEEWPAVPFVRLELSPAHVRQITDEPDGDKAAALATELLRDAAVLGSDREAAALFGRPTLRLDEPFGKLLHERDRGEEPPDWLTSLAHQVSRATHWKFPSVKWGLMRSANENDATWYSPVLTHVRRSPDTAMQFDIHFHRFACEAGSSAIELPLPENGAREAPAAKA
jgi:hypothetical protein